MTDRHVTRTYSRFGSERTLQSVQEHWLYAEALEDATSWCCAEGREAEVYGLDGLLRDDLAHNADAPLP